MPRTPDKRITIRLKPDEYAFLVSKAGNKPISAFLRILTLEKATAKRKSTKPAPIKDHKALAQILALLGQKRLVRAFKQAHRDIENGALPTDGETKQLLRDCKELLNQIHHLLMQTLGVPKR